MKGERFFQRRVDFVQGKGHWDAVKVFEMDEGAMMNAVCFLMEVFKYNSRINNSNCSLQHK